MADDPELAMNLTCDAIPREVQRADNKMRVCLLHHLGDGTSYIHTLTFFYRKRTAPFLMEREMHLEISQGKTDHLNALVEKVLAFHLQESMFPTRFTE